MPLKGLNKKTQSLGCVIKAIGLSIALVAAIATLGFVKPAPARAAGMRPVYIHMNGANEFLERLVFVRPGQKVVFVNEDTGDHAIQGYNPETGAKSKVFRDKVISGTPGPHHPVHTYTISFAHQGPQFYFCPVHAQLKKGPGGVWLPVRRSTTHGFGAAMAGEIIVTNDRALLARNPKTAWKKILPKFFGG